MNGSAEAWRRRGPGWPTPNPGASFSSDVSAFDYPGMEGQWFAHKLNDWVGGTPAEMLRRRYEFEQEKRQRQQTKSTANEDNMKAAKKSKTAKKATRKSGAKSKTKVSLSRPSKAKQAWVAEQKQIMEDADKELQRRAKVAAEMTAGVTGFEPEKAPTTHYESSGEVYNHIARGALLKSTLAAAVPGTATAELHTHLQQAHEQLAEWETCYAADLAAETVKVHSEAFDAGVKAGAKAVEDAYKADVKAIEDVYKAEAEQALAQVTEQATERAQNEALKDIAMMFGCAVDANPEQHFAFLQAQVKLRDLYREKAGGEVLQPVEIEKLKTRVLDAEEAKKVVAEQCKVVEKEREAALKAAKTAREFSDRMQKERDEAVKQFKVADEKLVALQSAASLALKNGHTLAQTETLAKAFEVVVKNDFDFAKALATADGKIIEEAAAALGAL